MAIPHAEIYEKIDYHCLVCLQVCATAGELEGASSRTRCTSVAGRPAPRDLAIPASTVSTQLMAGITGLLVSTVVALLLTLWVAARWRWRGWRRGCRRVAGDAGLSQDTGQLYRPPPPAEHDQHSRYVKLQATTKL